MEYCVVLTYDIVPISDYRFIHLFHILERAVAEMDDVRMVEVRVGSEKRALRVEIEVHCSV